MTLREGAGAGVRVAAVVPAAGAGERLGAGQPKALVTLRGESIVARAVRGLAAEPRVTSIVVIAPPGLVDVMVDAARGASSRVDLVITAVAGGQTRVASVRAGLTSLGDLTRFDAVLVHDAARCLTPPDVMARVIDEVLAGSAGVVPVLPVTDTIRQVDGFGSRTLDRSVLQAVQTPQGFDPHALLRAHALEAEGATDDAGLVEALGLPVTLVPGDAMAFKVTTHLDLLLADAVLAEADSGAASHVQGGARAQAHPRATTAADRPPRVGPGSADPRPGATHGPEGGVPA